MTSSAINVKSGKKLVLNQKQGIPKDTNKPQMGIKYASKWNVLQIHIENVPSHYLNLSMVLQICPCSSTTTTRMTSEQISTWTSPWNSTWA